jgi:RNA recognition motif-containing protein
MIIQVFNLSKETKDADLRRLFSPYGIVLTAEVSRNKFDGRSRCRALVDMPVAKQSRQSIV